MSRGMHAVGVSAALALVAGAASADPVYSVQSNTTALLESINGEAYHQLSPLHQGSVSYSSNPSGGRIGGSTSGAGISYTYDGSYAVSTWKPTPDITQFGIDLSAAASAAISYERLPPQWDIHSGLYSSSKVSTASTVTVTGLGQGNILQFVPSASWPTGASVKYLVDGGMQVTTSVSASAVASGSNSVSTPLDSHSLSLTFEVAQTHQSLNDILKNSVQVSSVGSTISATFKPSIGLDQAAALLSVDHFNWLQQVTHLPVGLPLQLVGFDGSVLADVLTDSNGNVLPDGLVPRGGSPMGDKRLLDPTPYAAMGSYYAYILSGGKQVPVPMKPGFIDGSSFYYGEGPALRGLPGSLDLHTSGAVSLDFFDQPGLPDALAGTDQYLGFETRLIGVDANGNEVALPAGLGLGFTWKSNAVFTTVTAQLAATEALPVFSGGVFDIRSDALAPVPEVPARTLLACGMLWLARGRWKWITRRVTPAPRAGGHAPPSSRGGSGAPGPSQVAAT